MATYTKDELRYSSLGETVSADFYRPSSHPPPWPVIITAPGFAGVKEMVIPAFGGALASVGIACVAPGSPCSAITKIRHSLGLDFIGFGASGGKLRQDIVPKDQITTLADGLDFLVKDERFDSHRIGLLGASLCGAHGIVLAERDVRIKTAMVIIPHISVTTNILDYARLFPRIVGDLLGRAIGMQANKLPSIGAPGDLAVMTTDGSVPWMEVVTKDAPSFRNEVTYASLLRMSAYDVKSKARKIKIPIFVITAKDDQLTPSSKIHDAFKGVDSATIHDFPGSHFGLFTERGEELNKMMIDWFQARL